MFEYTMETRTTLRFFQNREDTWAALKQMASFNIAGSVYVNRRQDKHCFRCYIGLGTVLVVEDVTDQHAVYHRTTEDEFATLCSVCGYPQDGFGCDGFCSEEPHESWLQGHDC